jgi:hypothetical protein
VSAIVPFRDPSAYSRVLRTVRRLWDEGTVEYHVHAIRAMQQSGLTAQDVERVIQTGSIIEHNRPGDEWRWKIQGGCVDGHTASCVIQIEINRGLLIVTVIDEAPERSNE